MEAIVVEILKGSAGQGLTGLVISIIALLFGAWLMVKKTKIHEVTSIGDIQQKQITTLLSQIEFLSEELSKTRKEISELHEQNVRLMSQLRVSNERLEELENILDSRKDLSNVSNVKLS